MKKKFFYIELEKELVIISSFITIVILYLCFANVKFLLNNFSNLYISQATLDGIDVSARVNLFYKTIILGTFLLTFFYFLLYKIRNNNIISKKDLNTPCVFAITGILLIILDIFGIESKIGIRFSILLFLFSIILIGFKYCPKTKTLGKLISFLPYILTTSLIIFSSIILLFNTNNKLINNSIWIFFIINLLLLLIVFIIKKYSHLFSRKFFLFLLPLTLIPLFIFISIESVFFFKSKYGFFIQYKYVFFILVAFTYICYIAFILKKPLKISTKKIFSNYIVPSALMSFLLLTLYFPIIEQPKDFFELSNPAIAQMRIFKFHEIPLIDFMSSHLFSEQFYGIIHNLIFGYNGDLAFCTYEFLYELIFYFIAYFFILKLFKNPFLALLFLISFPFVTIFFHTHLFYGIIVLFVILKLINKQTISNYIIFFSLIVFFIFWRLDTGISILFSSMVFLPLYFYIERKQIKFKTLIKSITLFILLILGLILILLIIKSPEYLLNNFKCAYHYISANQGHGFSSITRAFNQQFYVYHIIFPAISVFIILYIIYTLRKDYIDTQNRFTLLSSVFLFFLFIANFQRGLVRHSFIENDESYLISTFYIATSLFLFSYIKTKSSSWRYIGFLGISFIIMAFLKYFPFEQQKSNLEKFLTQPTLKNIDKSFHKFKFQGKIKNVNAFANQNYNELKQFLDYNLSPDQTFLDFSNTPMLYFYCQRRVPSYFCQNLQNTIDDFLQFDNLKKVTPNTVPVVIYSNYPPTWSDNTDDVPNVMRQYIIAEYIYKNYKPLGIINKHSIWVSKNSNFDWNIQETDTLIYKPQLFNYKKAAFIINKYLKNKIQFIDEGKPILENNEEYFFIEIKSSYRYLSNLFLKVITENSIGNQEIEFEIIGNNKSIGIIRFLTIEKENEYMVILSNHYLWFIESPKYIKIPKRLLVEIKKIEFYKDIRNEY